MRIRYICLVISAKLNVTPTSLVMGKFWITSHVDGAGRGCEYRSSNSFGLHDDGLVLQQNSLTQNLKVSILSDIDQGATAMQPTCTEVFAMHAYHFSVIPLGFVIDARELVVMGSGLAGVHFSHTTDTSFLSLPTRFPVSAFEPAIDVAACFMWSRI